MKTIKLTEAEKTLLRAADYIEEHGWCQYAASTTNGVCALNALSIVTVNLGELERAVEELEQRTGRLVVNWNDDPSRTKEEVLATLRSVQSS